MECCHLFSGLKVIPYYVFLYIMAFSFISLVRSRQNPLPCVYSLWQYSREYKGFVLWPCAVFSYLRIHGSVARIWVKVQSRSIRLLCSFLSHLHSRASSQKEWRCIIWKTQWRSGRVLAWHLWVHGLEDPRYCKRKIKCPALVVHICIGRQSKGEHRFDTTLGYIIGPRPSWSL